MTTFNLICEPWIGCVWRDGRDGFVGLKEALGSAQLISEISDESPLVVAALHRLLLAILHRTFGPRSTEEWGYLWRRGCFPEDVLDSYWEKWGSRFDLLDEKYPFYQSAGITEADGPPCVSVLEFHKASGNNGTLTDHTTDARAPALMPSEAARALVAYQCFALGGPVGYLKTSEKDSDKQASDAPCARGAVCLFRGKNLFQTLMLNMSDHDGAAQKDDIPSWERSPTQGRGERVPGGRVDLLTWQSRRIRLFGSAGGDRIGRVKIVPGFHVGLHWNPFKDESMQSFVLKSDAKPDERPWFQYRITPERAVWRDSGAIIHGASGEKRQMKSALTCSWIAQLVGDGELPDQFACRLEVMGFATDQAKIQMWRSEQLPIAAGLLKDQACMELLRGALNRAETAGGALKFAVQKVASEILAPTLDKKTANKPDTARAKGVKRLARSLGAEPRYWSALTVPFQEFLSGLGAAQSVVEQDKREAAENARFATWISHVRESALNAFSGACSGVGNSARGLRAHAIAESGLRRSLGGLAKKAAGKE